MELINACYAYRCMYVQNALALAVLNKAIDFPIPTGNSNFFSLSDAQLQSRGVWMELNFLYESHGW